MPGLGLSAAIVAVFTRLSSPAPSLPRRLSCWAFIWNSCETLPFPSEESQTAISLGHKRWALTPSRTMPSLCGFLLKSQSAPDPSRLSAPLMTSELVHLPAGVWGALLRLTCLHSCRRHLEDPQLPSVGLSPGPASAFSTIPGHAEVSGQHALV